MSIYGLMGVHFGVRLEDASQCILVVIGATADGKKELLAMLDGYRESAESWKELLLDLKQRGLTIDPKVAIGDGALGFWKALCLQCAVETSQRFEFLVRSTRVLRRQLPRLWLILPAFTHSLVRIEENTNFIHLRVNYALH